VVSTLCPCRRRRLRHHRRALGLCPLGFTANWWAANPAATPLKGGPRVFSHWRQRHRQPFRNHRL